MTPPELKGNLYVRATELTDTPDYQYGKWGRITTCPFPDHPHHYIKAWRFRYYEDKAVYMFGAWYYNKMLFPPFSLIPIPIPLIEFLPIPFYRYSIGKRRVVWNFPVISNKQNSTGWGWIIQNTIDYDMYKGKESSIYLDWHQANQNRKGE